MQLRRPWPCPECGAQLFLLAHGAWLVVATEVVVAVVGLVLYSLHASLWLWLGLFIAALAAVPVGLRYDKRPTTLQCPKCNNVATMFIGTQGIRRLNASLFS